MTCASPADLVRHGIPDTPDALDGHRMVGLVSSRTGAVMPLEFSTPRGVLERALPGRVMVNDAETMVDLARMG